jgi:hypothetical protein
MNLYTAAMPQADIHPPQIDLLFEITGSGVPSAARNSSIGEKPKIASDLTAGL